MFSIWHELHLYKLGKGRHRPQSLSTDVVVKSGYCLKHHLRQSSFERSRSENKNYVMDVKMNWKNVILTKYEYIQYIQRDMFHLVSCAFEILI